jgi:hypothetical protein
MLVAAAMKTSRDFNLFRIIRGSILNALLLIFQLGGRAIANAECGQSEGDPSDGGSVRDYVSNSDAESIGSGPTASMFRCSASR